MVILKRIYSETGLFDPVEFELGINIIMGFYSKGDKKSSGLNGIGKSTLVRLIDYMFISTFKKNNYFDPEKYSFLKKQDVILEFDIEDQTYFIKRFFDDPNKILFGKDTLSLDPYTEKEMKNVLSILFFKEEDTNVHFETGWFRDLIGFFVKDDMENFDRKDALNFVSSHSAKYDIYTYNLYLLGLPNEAVYRFSILSNSLKELQAEKRKNIERLEEETGRKIEEIQTDISEIERRIAIYEKSAQETYKFLEPYKEIESKLIKISTEISKKLKRFSFLRRNMNEYKKSYDYVIEVDPKIIAKEYIEVKGVLGDVIKKKLEEVIQFRKTLAENRRIFLKDKEIELESQINKISEDISELEDKRAELYNQLEQKKVLDSIKNSYLQLIEEKIKKEKLMIFLNNIESLENRIYEKMNYINKSIQEIKSQLAPFKKKINELTNLFFDITKTVVTDIGEGKPVFTIKPSPDMRAPLQITVEIPKSKALGKSRFKIIVYDLSVFLNIVKQKRKLPHFLIHDGAFHSVDIKTIVDTLNFINTEFVKYGNFQYIITANESEITFPDSKKESYGEYNFNIDDCIIARYTDRPEEMFFKRSYD